MTLDEKINDFHERLLKLAIEHDRLMEELPEDRHYHEGQKDLAGGLAVKFRVEFSDELKQYADETGK